MSDLQMGLLGIGACVIAGVYLFNVWQERQFRRRAELAFAREHDDVLLPGEPAAEAAPASRIEPKLETIQSPTEPLLRASRVSAAVLLDTVIDYVVEVGLAEHTESAELQEALMVLAADWGKQVLVAGYDATTGAWQPAGRENPERYSQLRFALQMSNRAGCIGPEQLRTFRAVVQEWSDRKGGEVKCLDIDRAHAMAVQLDRFCAEVDIAIGVNVVASGGSPFSGTKIRALAEAGGMKLESDGIFYLRGETGNTLYTLDNHEPMPFVPEQMKTLSTTGITFLLDVPRVPGALRVFEGMLECAQNFASALGGELVDDNRALLSDEAIEKIRVQLTGILAKMEAGQIAAGGARALRLFS